MNNYEYLESVWNQDEIQVGMYPATGDRMCIKNHSQEWWQKTRMAVIRLDITSIIVEKTSGQSE